MSDPITQRSSPLLPHALLWIGFLVVFAIGIVTVLIPEVQDDGTEEEGTAAGDTEATEPSEPPPSAAPAPAP